MNNSALALMISVRHRTKLFDIMAELQSSSNDISKNTSFNKRYVREWIGAMWGRNCY